MNHLQLDKMIDQKFDLFTQVSAKIWDYAELAWAETESSALQCETMEEQGFVISHPVSDMPTAFVAQWGQGKPVIGFLGEFDALPGMSQEAFKCEEAPILGRAAGHGCGHNILGVGAMEAAVAAKDYMEANGISGTVRYYGCPAEEGGCGKTFMVREGCFEGVDVCFGWHPGPACYSNMRSLANATVRFSFQGVASHAALAPHLGRSALDAVELMNVGVNFLREHVTSDVRMNYAITNSGGDLPNIVQAKSEVVYGLRGDNMDTVKNVLHRVQQIAQGAAMMTDTKVEWQVLSSYADLILNKTLTEMTMKNMREVFPIAFSEEDLKLAQSFKEIAPKAQVKADEADAAAHGVDPMRPMMDFPLPPEAMGHRPSTDVGDVSWNVPTSCFTVCSTAMGTPLHNWRTTAQVKSPAAHLGMKAAATIMAMGALQLMEDTGLLEQVKRDFSEALQERTYECLISSEVRPGKRG